MRFLENTGQRMMFAALILLQAWLAAPAWAQAVGVDHGLTLQRGSATAVTVSVDRLVTLPRVTQRVTQKTGKGEEVTEWSGPLLWDALVNSGIIDPAKHGEHPKLTLHAIGRDGYSVAIAVAELSPDFEGKAVIVADHLNGTALPDQTLRLVVPGDKRAGRSVRDLVRITID